MTIVHKRALIEPQSNRLRWPYNLEHVGTVQLRFDLNIMAPSISSVKELAENENIGPVVVQGFVIDKLIPVYLFWWINNTSPFVKTTYFPIYTDVFYPNYEETE